MTGVCVMKKIAIGLLLALGLCACSTAGRVSISGKAIDYELPTVDYEKHEAVVYPAGNRNSF